MIKGIGTGRLLLNFLLVFCDGFVQLALVRVDHPDTRPSTGRMWIQS